LTESSGGSSGQTSDKLGTLPEKVPIIGRYAKKKFYAQSMKSFDPRIEGGQSETTESNLQVVVGTSKTRKSPTYNFEAAIGRRKVPVIGKRMGSESKSRMEREKKLHL
jgi:hypothetical protein